MVILVRSVFIYFLSFYVEASRFLDFLKHAVILSELENAEMLHW